MRHLSLILQNNAADPVANSKIQAIFDYNSSADTVLSFKQGETAELIRKNPAGWWCVRISASRVGWVPQDYWKPISNRNHKVRSLKVLKPASDDHFVQIFALKLHLTKNATAPKVIQCQQHSNWQLGLPPGQFETWRYKINKTEIWKHYM